MGRCFADQGSDYGIDGVLLKSIPNNRGSLKRMSCRKGRLRTKVEDCDRISHLNSELATPIGCVSLGKCVSGPDDCGCTLDVRLGVIFRRQ